MSFNTLPSVLVVDDEPKNLYSVKRILEDIDIHVETKESGIEALKSLMHNEYFLILLDVQMPEMDGFETASLIRGNENYSNIPIIFQTAINKSEKYVNEGYEEGAVDYMFKPIKPQVLLSKVKVFLELYQRRKDLEYKNQELKGYDYIVAHDLKSPIKNIGKFVEFIKKDMGDNLTDKARHYFNRIETNTDQASNLIADLLSFSEASKIDDLKEQTELNALFKSVLTNLEIQISEADATISIEEFSKEVPVVPIKIRQLFQNLIHNSLKYKNSEPPLVEIYTSQDPLNGDFEINIKDNGIGFPSHMAEEIFKPFKRLHGKSEYEGSGIGLATCRRITDFHGWELNAIGDQDRGACFTITIPHSRQ